MNADQPDEDDDDLRLPDDALLAMTDQEFQTYVQVLKDEAGRRATD